MTLQVGRSSIKLLALAKLEAEAKWPHAITTNMKTANLFAVPNAIVMRTVKILS
jgi:hypothetical protein